MLIFLNTEDRLKKTHHFVRKMKGFVFEQFHTFFGNEPGHYSLFYKLQIPWGRNFKRISSRNFATRHVKIYTNNSLQLARKYAWIFVRGHYLFREANSFPWAKLKENCELRGTDNVQGQISQHIFKAKLRLLCLLSFKYFLQQAGSASPSYVNTSKFVNRPFYSCG